MSDVAEDLDDIKRREANALRLLRLLARMTTNTLSRRLTIPETSYRRIETAENRMAPDERKCLHEALRLPRATVDQVMQMALLDGETSPTLSRAFLRIMREYLMCAADDRIVTDNPNRPFFLHRRQG
jgi:hypothetical protein